ncbi:MAG: branched-chain amino acid ABC transporter permease [Pseudomonadota bacterium]
MSSQDILIMTLNGLSSGLTLMLVALGLTLVFGILHIINLAHGELYMMGAYCVWWLSERMGVNYWLAIVVAMIIIAFVGVLMERHIFRPFRGILIPSLVVSIGLMLFLQSSILLSTGMGEKVIEPVFHGHLTLLGVSLSFERVMIGVIAIVLVAGVLLFLKYARTGQAIRAVAQNAEAAGLQGISLNSISRITMIMGCSLAAAAGGLLGPIFYLDYLMGFPVLLKALLAVVIGGMGSVGGVILASLIIGVVESFAITLIGPEIAEIILFLMVIVILLIRPSGFFGLELRA